MPDDTAIIVEIIDGWNRPVDNQSFAFDTMDAAREFIRQYNNTHWHANASIRRTI